MFAKNKALSLLCAVMAIIMLLSSCGARNANAPITSGSEFETTEPPVFVTTEENTDTSEEYGSGAEDSDEATDGDDVIIEVQRPVADAPGVNDPSNSSSHPEENETEAPETSKSEENTEKPDDDGSQGSFEELPYADEVGVFVPYDVPMSEEDQRLVEEIAARFNVHEELVFGVMWAETRYDRTAVGKNDRYLGIMQVSLSNLSVLEKYLGVTDLMDFEQNVTAGCYFLGHYADLYDHNMNIMLLYYHGGYKYANPLIEQGVFEDGYVREVFAEMNRIIEARKQTAAEMGVKLKGWLYEY